MIQEKKQEEYDLMENSPKRILTVQIKNGPMLKVNNCWDFAKNFNTTQFKTTSEITIEHPLLEIERINLVPITHKKIWKVTVRRQEPSNLLNNASNSNKNPQRG